MGLLRISSERNAKILVLERSQTIAEDIQTLLKELGITRDWRKHVLEEARKTDSFETNSFYYADTKDGDIKCSIFVGTDRIVLQIVYDGRSEEKVASQMQRFIGRVS